MNAKQLKMIPPPSSNTKLTEPTVLSRKLLIILREDGRGFNLMLERRDQTLTKQIGLMTYNRIIDAILEILVQAPDISK